MKPKPSIQTLKPYKTKDLNYLVKLDANEATRNILNNLKDMLPENLYLYPDNYADKLREYAAKYYNVTPNNLIAGNGSSEMIELVLKTFVDKDEVVLSFEPSFSMYRVFSEIYSAKFIPIESRAPFEMNLQALLDTAQKTQPKVIFLCTPNNPTGAIIPLRTIQTILENTEALVIVDEAYIEFYDTTKSMIQFLNKYPNLVILRTLSKAFGLAGIRLGFLIANPSLVETLNMVKAPYNLNALSQQFGIQALKQRDTILPYLQSIKDARLELYQTLKSLSINVFTSYANFLFFESTVPNLFDKLLSHGILIRRYKDKLENYYRVSIGTNEENTLFLTALKEVIENETNNTQS